MVQVFAVQVFVVEIVVVLNFVAQNIVASDAKRRQRSSPQIVLTIRVRVQ